MALVWAVIACFWAGAFPFSWLIAKAKGVDLREVGSRNCGATNAGRILGGWFFLLCLVLDAGKGILAVWYMQSLTPEHWWWVGAAAAAIAGHCFSPFLGWRGGKGVATTLGVLVILQPFLAVVAAAVWVSVFLLARIVSLASVVSAMVVLVTALIAGVHSGDPLSFFVATAASFVVAKHRSNLVRLWNGEESRIWESRS